MSLRLSATGASVSFMCHETARGSGAHHIGGSGTAPWISSGWIIIFGIVFACLDLTVEVRGGKAGNWTACQPADTGFELGDHDKWFINMYAKAVEQFEILNTRDALQQQEGIPPTEALEEEMELEFLFPVFVINGRPERRDAVAATLQSTGFTNVSFPLSPHWRELDLEELVEQRKVDWETWLEYTHSQWGSTYEWQRAMPYLANTFSVGLILAEAVRQDLPLVGVFEDDIVLGCPAAEARCRISQAIEHLPPTADMLYLEACQEYCSHLKPPEEGGMGPLLRAVRPLCAASIIFTRRGVKKLVEAIFPVKALTDNLYQDLIEKGTLEAYLASPLVFFQDGRWPSTGQQIFHPPPRSSVPVMISYTLSLCIPRLFCADYVLVSVHRACSSLALAPS
uniref:Uncharacterized protein n=1 Tax=Hemiselmis tepida TaxID=464990 RepID=A0A7S0V333_9CRYP